MVDGQSSSFTASSSVHFHHEGHRICVGIDEFTEAFGTFYLVHSIIPMIAREGFAQSLSLIHTEDIPVLPKVSKLH